MDQMGSIIHIIFYRFCSIYHAKKSSFMNKFVNIHGNDQVLIRCSGCIGVDAAEGRQFCRNVEFRRILLFERYCRHGNTSGDAAAILEVSEIARGASRRA